MIDRLGLVPHPEGGWYRETWRADGPDGGRGASTAIHFLLAEGERSHWHRVDADEAWHHYAGAPLELAISIPATDATDPTGASPSHTVHRLDDSLAPGTTPQVVVPAGAWQAARPTGPWTLVGCTVAPAFDFAGFELAPPGWTPDGWPTPNW